MPPISPASCFGKIIFLPRTVLVPFFEIILARFLVLDIVQNFLLCRWHFSHGSNNPSGRNFRICHTIVGKINFFPAHRIPRQRRVAQWISKTCWIFVRHNFERKKFWRKNFAQLTELLEHKKFLPADDVWKFFVGVKMISGSPLHYVGALCFCCCCYFTTYIKTVKTNQWKRNPSAKSRSTNYSSDTYTDTCVRRRRSHKHDLKKPKR